MDQLTLYRESEQNPEYREKITLSHEDTIQFHILAQLRPYSIAQFKTNLFQQYKDQIILERRVK